MPRRLPGTKREVRPGLWEVSVSNGYREDGRQRREYRYVEGTEADADAELVSLAADMGRSPSIGKMATLADYWPAFERKLLAKGVSNATISDYEKEWRLRVRPQFGDLRWSQLRFRDVQQWIYGLTHSQAEHSIRFLRRYINSAIDDELCDRNPLDHRRIDYPIERVDPLAPPQQTWLDIHVAAAIDRMRGERMEPLFLALLGGGLRVEEGIPLWWDDLGFSPVTLMDGSDGLMCHASIYKSWTQKDGLHGTKNRFSTRMVPIPEPFASRLAELSVEGPRVPLWPLSPGNVRREWSSLWKHGGSLSGLPRVHMKDLRSIHETMMQDAGALDTVNARLHGRTNVQTGYRHYLRPSAALDSAAQAMGERVKRAI